MQINLSLDSSVSQAPSNFMTLLNQGVQFLEQTFINPITITIQIGWGELEGTPLASDLAGEAGPVNGATYTYNQVVAAMAGGVASAADATAVANLPTTDPTHGGTFFIGEAEEKALGLVGPNGGGIDGAAGFQGSINVGVIIHEITHAMGRIDILGQSASSTDTPFFGSKGAEFAPLDLFRYTGAGAERPTAAAAYFSIDGGKTVINTYDPSDTADWNNRTNDAFNSEFDGVNVPNPVTTGDLEEMDVLGYTLANPTVTGTLLNLTSIPETVLGAPGETIIGSSGTAVINALGGHQTIIGGSGATTVFAAAGDNVTGGPGPIYVDGSSGGVTITIGPASGSDTIIGSAAPVGGAGPDTLIGGGAAVLVQGMGSGDVVNFSNQTGVAAINATAGNIAVTLGAAFAAVYGGIGDTIAMGTVGQLATGYTGGTKMTAGSGGTDSMIGSVTRAAGASGDTLIGGVASVVVQGLGQGDIVLFANETGSAAINALAGNDAITLGSGPASVFGGIGDTINFGGGNQYADGLTGGTSFLVGTAGGSDTIVGSPFRTGTTGVDTLTGGAAAVLVEGLGAGDIVNFANQTGSAAINATAGNNAVTLGSGAATVFGGVGGSIVLGSGAQLAAAFGGGETIAVGTAGGNDTIVGSAARASGAGVDTVNGGAAAVDISSLGAGDIVNFAAQTGTAVINALAGSNIVTLGNAAATVFGGVSDAITLGTGNQYVDASFATGATIKLGSGGADNIAGSMLAGSGATIKGGAAALTYNAGTGSDLIDLTGTSGSAVINGLGADTSAINDTIIAGNGGTTVFGGSGDRIGVGANATGTDQFFHSTTIAGASVGFGTNGSAANSSAQVTVTGFAESGGNATDFLFYQGENPGTNMSIVTGSTQTTVNGAASTVLTLPDGTVMTLVGIAKADLSGSFFKA